MRPGLILQYSLPHRFLSRLVYWATRWTFRPWKNFLIGRITKAFAVNLDEAAERSFDAYPHFNAFFTRALKAGARPIDSDSRALVSPADGRVSQAGEIRAGRILQAKGQDYTAEELLGDEAAAATYRYGSFATIYLSPRDYHRVHMPQSGTLIETLHVPGRIFSVATAPVAEIPRLFARNERLVCHFDGEHGPFVVVLVGALLVSGVSTVWGGMEIPPYASRIVRKDYRGKGIRLERGAEMGRFNMGSTVILLHPPGEVVLDSILVPDQPLSMGQRIGLLS